MNYQNLGDSPIHARIGMVIDYAGQDYVITGITDDDDDDNYITGFLRITNLSDTTIHEVISPSTCAIDTSNIWEPAYDHIVQPYIKCNDCGNYYSIKRITYVDHDPVCLDCLYDNYVRCDNCNVYFNNNTDLVRVDSELVCQSCIDDSYNQCNTCNNYVHGDHIHNYSHYYFCESCFYDEYSYCDDCSEAYCRDDLCTYNDNYYCNACCPDQINNIYDYGANIDFHFYNDKNKCYYSPDSDTMYYGMELELEVPICVDKNDIAEHIVDVDKINYLLKHDGSLTNGFEVITHARTFKSWKLYWSDFDRDVLKPAIKNNCTAHDSGTCGIHIHTSLSAWKGDQLFRLFSLLYNPDNYDELLTISQRKKNKLDQYASLDMDDIGKAKDRIQSKKSPFTGRYAALNITEETLEFRLFNSNLRIERVRKNMEFVYALYRYTSKTKNVTWEGLMSWIKRNKKSVPNLYGFLIEKGIIVEEIPTVIGLIYNVVDEAA